MVRMMSIAGYAPLLAALLLGVCVPRSEAAAPDRGGAATPTRQQLVGAWRLVSITVSDSGGDLADPFYQAGSEGIIVYDSSGWLSVQIAAPNRRTFAIPESRSASRLPDPDARMRAAAFDTYYSYFGTWDLDEANAVVTHHVKSSLIPAETGLSYAQTVTLEDGRLTFTVRDVNHGKETIRRKVWQRIGDVK
jgi:hypothetical protein